MFIKEPQLAVRGDELVFSTPSFTDFQINFVNDVYVASYSVSLAKPKEPVPPSQIPAEAIKSVERRIKSLVVKNPYSSADQAQGFEVRVVVGPNLKV